MNAQEMWEAYSRKNNISSDYSAWAFGDDPDTLAQLVLVGTKTATASAAAAYALEGENLPKAGEFSVVLDSKDNAVCVIRSTKVYSIPFSEVRENHAWQEGEGDRSLAYWRLVHERFFSNWMKEVGIEFSESMIVVCEEFEKVYP